MRRKAPAQRGMIRKRQEFLTAELRREHFSYEQVQQMDTDRSKVGLHIIGLTIAQIETELAWLGRMMANTN